MNRGARTTPGLGGASQPLKIIRLSDQATSLAVSLPDIGNLRCLISLPARFAEIPFPLSCL